MPNTPPAKTRPSPLYLYVVLAAVLFVFIQSFPLLSPILLSLLLTLFISLAVNPLISRLRIWTGGRKVAAALIAAALVTILALTGWAFSGPMKTSVTKLVEQLPTYWERLQKPLIKIEQQAVRSEEKLQKEVSTEIASTETATNKPVAVKRAPEPAPPKVAKEPVPLPSSLVQMLQGVVGSFTSVALDATQILLVLVTVFFGVTFTLMNPRPIFRAMFSLTPERHHDQALSIVQRTGKFLPAWAGATLLGMVTIGVLVFLLMWPIFGFMDALVLGLIAGVMEAVPYLGPVLSALPGLLLALGQGGMTPLWVLAAYAAIQMLENNLIMPVIMARGMKLHPVAVIFSMLFCVAAFGVLGVLIAAPMVAIVDILHDELYRKRFLPTVTDAELNRLARQALHETASEDK